MFKKILCAISVFLFFSTFAVNTFADIQEKFEQARVYIDAGQYEEAEAIYKGVQKSVSDVNNLLYNLPEGQDVSEQLLGIADFYRGADEYASARRIYEFVIETWPDSNEVAFAKESLATNEIRSEIALGNIKQAERDVNDLLIELPEDMNLPETLKIIADIYLQKDMTLQARELYIDAVNSVPEGEGNIWSQVNLVKSNLKLGDVNGYTGSYEKLIADFNDHPKLAAGLQEIGILCLDLQQEQEAGQVLQRASEAALENKGEDALFQSRMSLILKYICTEEDTEAQAVIDGFIGDFKGRPEFSKAVATIMETYEMKVFYRSIRGEVRARYWVQPTVTWEKVTTADKEFFCDDAGLYYFIGVCYYQLEEYDVATTYLHSVAYNWPDEKKGKDAKAFIKDQPEKVKINRRNKLW